MEFAPDIPPMNFGRDMGHQRGFFKCSSITDDQTPDNGDSGRAVTVFQQVAKPCNTLSPDVQDHTIPYYIMGTENQDCIVPYRSLDEIFQSRLVCTAFRDIVKRKNFQQARSRVRPVEYHLSLLVFYVKDDLWHILGLDYDAKIWRTLPPFPPPVPAPDTDLFKDFLVASHPGLFLVNVGRLPEAEKLLVCNILTGSTMELPSLEYQRHPVVLHLQVTLTKTYLVIAVGSSATGTESLSKKTEVYDSAKGKWALAGDVPGSEFSLNDHQTGVYFARENLLFCVGLMTNGMKGILAFDIGKREWREDWVCRFPAEESVHFAIAQLVECDGAIYLFSEQESGRTITHCIDRLDFVSGTPGCVWTRKVKRDRHGYHALLVYPEYTCVPLGHTFVECNGVVYLFSETGRAVTHCIDKLDSVSESRGFVRRREFTRQRQGNRALLVYPEFTCVPVRENKLCILNTIDPTGVVYNLLDDPINPEKRPAAPLMDDGDVFRCLIYAVAYVLCVQAKI